MMTERYSLGGDYLSRVTKLGVEKEIIEREIVWCNQP